MLDLKSIIPWGQKSDSTPTSGETNIVPFDHFRQEIDRVFEDFFNRGSLLGSKLGANGFGALTLRVDVSENDKELVVTAELPGVDEKDLDVTLTGDVLAIKGQKKQENESKDGDRRYVERSFGSFTRSVRLPFEASDQNVEADMKNGVLTVRIPKPADYSNRSKRIEIKAA